MSIEHASITSFRGEHTRRGGTGEVVILPDSAHTAALAAAALGCDVGAIANSLLFDADGEPVLVLTSGAHRVDTAAVARRIGVGRLKRADPEFVRRHTGQVIGGVSPIDHPAPVRTWIDPWLKQHDVIWAAAAIAGVLLLLGLVMLFFVARLIRRGWRRWKKKDPIHQLA